MDRVCESEAIKFITTNSEKIRSVRVDTTGISLDETQPVKRTREIYERLRGITVLEIFAAGFDAGMKGR